VRFVHPLLLLTAIPLAAIAIWLALRRPREATTRSRIAGALRGLSFVLIVLALAQPQVGHGSDRPMLLLLDRSASIDAAAGGRQLAWLHAAGDSGAARPYGVVQFAGVSALTSAADGLLPIGGARALDARATDLEGALRLALGRVPRGGRLVVVSDGFETTGDALGVAALARARGVAIDAARLSDSRRDAGIARLQAPSSLHAGDPLPLAITVRSTVAGTARVALRRDGVAAGHESLALRAGDTPLLLSLTAPAAPGTHAYELRVTLPGDEIPQDDALEAAVRVARQPRVLVASRGGPALASMLSGDGLDVRQVDPAALPSTTSGYRGEDAVVLDDVSATALGPVRAAALVGAVRTGGLGLLAFGGGHSFSLGRYAGSAIDKALPVASLRPGNRQQRDLALEVVLDRSGSMSDTAGGTVPKIQMAQAAARVATRFAARHRDQLGIVSFDITPRTLAPLAPIAPGRAVTDLDQRIDALQADGGTNIFLALQSAAQQIATSTQPQRHIILMSDGVSEAGDYAPLLARLAREKVTVSTVALGAQADARLLRTIATRTHGRFYAVSDATKLPSIFARDARRTARPTRLHGRIAITPGADSPVVHSLGGRSLPPLRGNVVTTLRPGAQADLLGADPGHPPDPVLAQWQYGAGRVVTWTPGLDPAMAGAWAADAALWQDATRWVERVAATPLLAPSLPAGGGDPAALVVDPVANGGAPVDLAALSGSLVAPGGQPIRLRFTQTGASRYTAPLPAALPAGVYRSTVSATGGAGGAGVDGAIPAATGGLAIPYAAEYQPRAAGAAALGPLAAATGGRLLDVRDATAIASSWTAIWRWLALGALAAFLAGVGVRMLTAPRRQ
jgi:Ca-activated chloride channel family protein